MRQKPVLRRRERAVLEGIARGLTNAEIASELGIGFETVKTYVTRLRVRLGLPRGDGRPSGRPGGRHEALAQAARCYFEGEDA